MKIALYERCNRLFITGLYLCREDQSTRESVALPLKCLRRVLFVLMMGTRAASY